MIYEKCMVNPSNGPVEGNIYWKGKNTKEDTGVKLIDRCNADEYRIRKRIAKRLNGGKEMKHLNIEANTVEAYAREMMR